jgi:ABC-type glycerol-3-phosphate transport system substrate-binding protein
MKNMLKLGMLALFVGMLATACGSGSNKSAQDTTSVQPTEQAAPAAPAATDTTQHADTSHADTSHMQM